MLARKELPLEEDKKGCCFFLNFCWEWGHLQTTSNNLVLLCGTFTGQFSKKNSGQVCGINFNPIEKY